MTLRLKLSLFISAVFALLLSLFVGGAQYSSLMQAQRHTHELLLAARRRIEIGLKDAHVPLTRLVHEEKGISPQPLSLALYREGQRVELVGHEPPQDGEGWQISQADLAGYHLVLGYPYYQTQQALSRQLFYLASLAALVWVALSGAAYWLVGQVLRPIQMLSHQARALGTQMAPPALESPSADNEVLELVDTLNELLQQRERSTRQREQFYVAISHELRTPLQALSGHLELALLRTRTPVEYQTFLEECQRQTSRLKSLHEAILTLSQVDHGPLEYETVYDLAEFLPEFLPPEAQARLSPSPTVASQRLVELLLRNLVENAARHGQPPLVVELDPHRLTIINQRRDQETLDLTKLSEPFYRPESSRQRGGNGLGLALVRAIAQRLGWQLELFCNESTFEVHLGLTPPGET